MAVPPAQEKQVQVVLDNLILKMCELLSIAELDKVKSVIRKKEEFKILRSGQGQDLLRAKSVEKFVELLLGRASSELQVNGLAILIRLMKEVSRYDIVSAILSADEEITGARIEMQIAPSGSVSFSFTSLITEQQNQEAYKKALEEGSKQVHRTRIMIVGQERVGKTSLMRSLTHQSFNGNELSTEGINASLICSIDIKQATSWQLHKDGDDSSSLQHEFKHSMRFEVDSNLESLIVQKHQGMGNTDATMMPSSYSIDLAPEHGAEAATPPPPHGERKSPVDKSRQPVMDSASARRKHASGTEEPLVLSFWDFAGQDLYYTTHQTFLSSRAIYVVVFNLCQDLDKPVPIADNTRPKNGKSCHRMTPLQYLDFWMRSIFTYTKENSSLKRLEQMSPPIFIVGTHRNSVGGADLPDSERKVLIDDIFTQIRREINNKPYLTYVVNPFYAIENSLESKDAKITELRDHIQSTARKEPYMGEDIPLRWLQFDMNKLKEVTKSGGIPVLTLKQVKDRYEINDETELLTMLKFYHDLGHIIYFGGDDDEKSQALKDVIILDPQWLIDAFKKVITVTPPKAQVSGHVTSWNRLKDDGILEDTLIDYMWHDILLKKKALLDLMDKFDLLCERVDQPKDEDHSSPAASSDEPPVKRRKPSKSGPVVSYYVPSMLQRQSSRSSESSEKQNANVFFVDFQGFLPDGLFHRLVVRALRWSQTLGGEYPVLEYDCASFYVDDQHEFALQMVRQEDVAAIKVSIMRAPVINSRCEKAPEMKTPSPEVTKKVRGFVDDDLQNLKKDLWIKRISYSLSVQCPCKRGSLHFLPLDKCMANGAVPCRIEKRPQMLVKTDEIQAMFSHESSEEEPTALEEKQPMSDVHFREIAKELGAEWKELATYLGFKPQDIHRWKVEESNVDDQIFAMLVKWRNEREQNVKKMRKELVEALKKIEQCELADKVENY